MYAPLAPVFVAIHPAWPWTTHIPYSRSQQSRQIDVLCGIYFYTRHYRLIWCGSRPPSSAPAVVHALYRSAWKKVAHPKPDPELHRLVRAVRSSRLRHVEMGGFWANLCVKEAADHLRSNGFTVNVHAELSLRRLV